MKVSRGSRLAHRRHVRDARRWCRYTRGDDWVLVKFYHDPEFGYVYLWAGPPRSGVKFPAYGTIHSAMLLHHLREALASYRHALAQEIAEPAQDAMMYTI